MNSLTAYPKFLLTAGLLFALLLIYGISDEQVAANNLPDTIDFNFHIRPIISQNCFVCHGPDTSSRKADLRLDTEKGALAFLKNGHAIISPGKPEKSELLARISSNDPDFRMPPPESRKHLTEREIALIRKWIQQGAKWKKHWSFIKPSAPELPDMIEANGPSSVVDYIITRKLEDAEIALSGRANKSSLIRRTAYLLTGLPPTETELLKFEEKGTEYNFTDVVDYYLGSPHFGERWARHWMDLVRYGEFRGHEFDYPIGGAWQYRDYLIRAFNQDVPYDQFVVEHLAGDLLEEPRIHPVNGFNESIIGTAYAILGEGKHSPVSVREEEATTIDNMIDVTSKTFQALTVGCARCHDHKFDPIPTTDYYAMYGMFESSRIGPIGIGQPLATTSTFQRIRKIKEKAVVMIEGQWDEENRSPEIIEAKKQLIANLNLPLPDSEEGEYSVIGNFLDSTWYGWNTTGTSFGLELGTYDPFIESEINDVLLSGGSYASSRYYAPGLHGTLRSPNFVLLNDSLAIIAKGDSSTIRIIVDNFQLIQDPLYGSFSTIVDDPDWKIYTLDVSMVKGHKAYLEIIPGYFNQHLYEINPGNYIDVQYAIAYDSIPPKLENVNIRTGVRISKKLTQLANDYRSLSHNLFQPDYFTGLTDGNALLSKVFIRGNYQQESKEFVSRQFLSAIQDIQVTFPETGSGRLAWAKSLVDPENPLTARVMVNRLWHHIFGRGIVETVDNFGLQGNLPTHPELLDYLAIQFVKDGWSVKQMLKIILLSDAYQRSTEPLPESILADPQNLLLHHFPMRRLEAEAIRDGILATAGSLNKTMYGKSIPIHLTDFMTGRGRPGKSGPLDGDGRRSVYTEVRRNFLIPMMTVFDMPIPFSSFGKRDVTNVPAQSLTLMNDPFVHDQANKWALQLVTEFDSSISERIQKIYKGAFARGASDQEVVSAQKLIESLCEKYNCTSEEMKNDPRLWKEYCHVIFNCKEFIYLI